MDGCTKHTVDQPEQHRIDIAAAYPDPPVQSPGLFSQHTCYAKQENTQPPKPNGEREQKTSTSNPHHHHDSNATQVVSRALTSRTPQNGTETKSCHTGHQKGEAGEKQATRKESTHKAKQEAVWLVKLFDPCLYVPLELTSTVGASEFTGGIVIEFNLLLTVWAENLNHGTRLHHRQYSFSRRRPNEYASS